MIAQSLGDAIKRGIKNHVLIISGGVSVGEHDLVKEALRELGAKIEIWRVAVKPGKPFLFGWFESETVDSAGETPAAPQARCLCYTSASSLVCPEIPCRRS